MSKESHILAANVDQALLFVTLSQPQTPNEFVDRFLVTAKAYGVPVVLVVNKIDLLGEEDAVMKAMKAVENVEVASVANVGGEYKVVLKVSSGADVREAVFRSVCANSLVLLEMANGVKSAEELLMALHSERVAHRVEAKEEQGNESNL